MFSRFPPYTYRFPITPHPACVRACVRAGVRVVAFPSQEQFVHVFTCCVVAICTDIAGLIDLFLLADADCARHLQGKRGWRPSWGGEEGGCRV